MNKLLIIILLGFSNLVFGQSSVPTKRDSVPPQTKPKLIALGRAYGADSVVLRWSPNMPAYWLAGNKRGYIIERTEYIKDVEKPTIQLLQPSPVKPWTFDEMKNRLDEDEKGIGVVGEMIYGYPSDKKFSADFFAIKQLTNEQNMRFATTLNAAEFDPKAADAAGLRYVDKNIKKENALYFYKIYLAPSGLPNAAVLDTASVFIDPSQKRLTFSPFVESPEIADHRVSLVWRRIGPLGDFSGYYIEKSEDNKSFKRLNEIPYLLGKPDPEMLKKDTLMAAQFAKWHDKVFYIDSLAQNFKPYYYRIIGIDSFGELSPASDVITAVCRDLTAPKPATEFKAKNNKNVSITLSWKKEKPEGDFKGFVIGRGPTVNGPFKPLVDKVLPPETSTFTDLDPQAYIGDYYIMAVVDTSGNLGYTLPIAGGYEDHKLPQIPTGLVAKVDSLGRVVLNWPPSPDLDIQGFKVYRSYKSANEYYNQLTPTAMASLSFTDTLPKKMLNEYVYYRLVAVDLSNNHSEFSKVLEVKLPDRNPPTTPVIKDVTVKDDAIEISMITSQSADVVLHQLFRKNNAQKWEKLKDFPVVANSSTLVYIDKNLEDGQLYEYALQAKDDDGLESPQSFGIPVKYFKRIDYQTIDKFETKINDAKNAIILTWQPINDTKLSHYLIYKNVNNGGLEMIGSSQSTSFTDKDFLANNTYQYAIRVAYQNGKKSKIGVVKGLKK